MPYDPDALTISRDYRLTTADDAERGDPITQAQLDRVADEVVAGTNIALHDVFGVTTFRWDASLGTFPTTRPNGAPIQSGDQWNIIKSGATGGVAFNIGGRIVALVDDPTQTYAENWAYRDERPDRGQTTTFRFVGDGETKSFAMPFDPLSKDNVRVFLGPTYQHRTEFDLDGVNLIFKNAPFLGLVAEVELVLPTDVGLAQASSVVFPDGQNLGQVLDSMRYGSVTETLLVPSQYPTMQAALNHARNIAVMEGETIEVMIEAGHRLDSPAVMVAGDFGHIRISSQDPEVLGADTIANGTNMFTFIHCRAPIWNIIFDMRGKGRNGVWLETATMVVVAQKGVRRAGAFGPEPRGCNFFGWKGSSLQCEPVNAGGALVGIISTDAAVRGVDITHNSQASLVGGQFINNGTSPLLSEGHAHVFVSRSSFVQLDNSLFQGGVRAIRNARSIVTARTAVFRDVAGEVVRQFEGGFTIVAASDFRNCGAANHPMFYVAGADETRPQGGGYICAESALILDPQGEIAVAIGGNALISLEGAIADDLTNHLVRATTGGKVIAPRISGFPTSSAADEPTPHVSARAGYSTNELVLLSDAGVFEAMGGKLDANGVRNVARLANGSSLHMRGGSFIGMIQEPIRLDSLGSTAFTLGSTFEGAWDLPSVYTLDGPVQPEHFGAVGNGAASDQDAIVRWLAWGRNLEGKPGSVYAISGRPGAGFQVASDVNWNGAAIRWGATDATMQAQFVVQSGFTMRGLRASFIGANTVQRFITMNPASALIDYDIAGPAAVPLHSTAGAGYVFLNGAGIKLRQVPESGAQIGYVRGVGAGGEVTQAGGKNSDVTLNRNAGRITTANTSMAAGASAIFRVRNDKVDRLTAIVAHVSEPPVNYEAIVNAVGAGFFDVLLTNRSAGSLSEAVSINFATIQGTVT